MNMFSWLCQRPFCVWHNMNSFCWLCQTVLCLTHMNILRWLCQRLFYIWHNINILMWLCDGLFCIWHTWTSSSGCVLKSDCLESQPVGLIPNSYHTGTVHWSGGSHTLKTGFHTLTTGFHTLTTGFHTLKTGFHTQNRLSHFLEVWFQQYDETQNLWWGVWIKTMVCD